jgi:predicted hydrolase (HD superfamily)
MKETPDLNEIASAIVILDNKIFARIKADRDELSISDMKCMDNAIKEYKDVDSYALSDLSHDVAWEKAYTRSQDDPEKNKMTLIEIAKAGKAKQDIIDEIRECEIIKRAFHC